MARTHYKPEEIVSGPADRTKRRGPASKSSNCYAASMKDLTSRESAVVQSVPCLAKEWSSGSFQAAPRF